MKFIELYLNGVVTENDIHKFIVNWHEDENSTQELHEYLGMSWEEYSVCITNPSNLSVIAHIRGINLPLYSY